MSKKLCAYCGERDATDKEHVFPKCLYPESKAMSKVQRLTIQSCNLCNNGWADDEAHFRNILSLAGEPNDCRDELWNTTIQRSFKQVDGPRRIQDIVNTWQPVEIDGKSKPMVYPGKDPRVIRVVKKIVRGLSHYHNILSAVPESHVWADVMKYRMPEEFLTQLTYAHREPDVAEYYFSVIEEVGIQSAWLITFFEKIKFIVIIESSKGSLDEGE
ncbi:hypothetical protein [Candidatus Nitrotoga arctica]|uniref:HNH endonuclease n=1 Tax=Candidatus Nitrotoga arctica TaxID=453162 RepID=A0ABN8AI68_9PROT|nr:hypothetical protein [Candidatus Nitrotoga arctica]CAG9931496.1 conserved protein of unknown function [Candidatus Nitrotoga arctica]